MSNRYTDTSVRDLEVAFFKANDICSKDLSSRPIYAVLNTHNLDIVIVVTRGQFVAVFKHRLKHVNVKFIHNNEFD